MSSNGSEQTEVADAPVRCEMFTSSDASLSTPERPVARPQMCYPALLAHRHAVAMMSLDCLLMNARTERGSADCPPGHHELRSIDGEGSEDDSLCHLSHRAAFEVNCKAPFV